jgi:hypothetical protein
MEDAEDGAAGPWKKKKITITIWFCAISKNAKMDGVESKL